MKKLILLIIPIFVAEFCFSQTDFRKGYVITNTRDTLFGLIDYRESAKSYKTFDFKKSKEQNTITYEPNDVIGYGFENDKFFQSREISIKGQPSKVVFIEVIVRGLVSLYKFENIYFVEKGNNGPQQLINETKEAFVEGKRVLKRTNQYVGTINMLVFDCPETRDKVQKTTITERALTSLVEGYNRCKGEPGITFKAKKPWTTVTLGMTGGLNISQLSFEAKSGYQHLTGVFEISKSPTIGVSFDISTPRLSERISFHGDLLYLTSKYYKYTLFTSSTYTERNYVTIELQQLKIPIGIRYTFPKREFTPFFNLGVASTIHLSSNSSWIKEVESYNVVNTNNTEALKIKPNQFGLWGGCGVVKSINTRLTAFAEVRYELTEGIHQNTNDPLAGLQSKITNFQILIGIRTK